MDGWMDGWVDISNHSLCNFLISMTKPTSLVELNVIRITHSNSHRKPLVQLSLSCCGDGHHVRGTSLIPYLLPKWSLQQSVQRST